MMTTFVHITQLIPLSCFYYNDYFKKSLSLHDKRKMIVCEEKERSFLFENMLQ